MAMPSSNGPFIPRGDADFKLWAQAFVGGIAANPALYGLTPADAAALTAELATFDAAYDRATKPPTRTAVTVQAKNTARNALESFCRVIAAQIKVNHGVSDGDKIAIGVRPPRRGWNRRPKPTTSPILDFIAATPGRHGLTVRDSLTPESREKPYGADRVELFMALTPDHSKVTVDAARYVGSYSEWSIVVDHPAGTDGMVATYWARWANTRGETGPWSVPVSFRVNAAGTTAGDGGQGKPKNSSDASDEGDDRIPFRRAA